MKRRIRHEDEVGELNIVPYLDIVTNLVMFMLLSMTGLITLGVVNVSAPKIGGASAAANPGENKPHLVLTVGIAKDGFYVTAASTGGDAQGGPAVPTEAKKTPDVPLRNGKYDYDTLTQKMVNIKHQYPSETSMILVADPDAAYETVIATMDACREAKEKLPDGSIDRRPLFFDVALGGTL